MTTFLSSSAVFSAVTLTSTSLTFSTLTKVSTANVTISSSSLFDGPAVAQGTVGTWYVAGKVTMTSSGSSNFPVVLWDGTTVIASDYVTSAGGSGFFASSCLSGVITSPAGNLRMSATNNTLKTGTIQFNASGLNADSYIVAVRIG